MEFRILGPLEVRERGRSLPLGGTKQRALLAILLLHANDLVSTDRIIDELWGEEPPDTARNVIQVYISQIRKILATAAAESARATLETRQPGYVLHVTDDDFDLSRFERLTGRARTSLEADDPSTAARLFEDAISLWRGEPLADFRLEPFAQTAIDRLDELLLATREDLAEAQLLRGRGASLVPELEALVEAHPLRERLRAHLMQALYQGGRQADALEVYRTGAERLADDLGIDPGPNLQHLHEAILRQDPALGPSDLAATSEAEAADEGERRTVTLLIAQGAGDGFSSLASASGGHEIDGADDELHTAVFGFPRRDEADAERAAALAFAVLRGQPGSRTAVVTARIAASSSIEHASELLAERARDLLGADGSIAIDADTAGRLRSQYPVETEGRSSWLRPPADAALVDIPNTPLVGRDREVGMVRGVINDLATGRGSVVSIEGETGMGKTRLLWEMAGLDTSDTVWLQGSCAVPWAPSPYLGIATALRRWVGAGERADGDEVRDLLGSVLAGLGEDPSLLMDKLEPLIGTGADPNEPPDRVAGGLRALLEVLCQRGAVALALDDVHLIDDATATVVTELLSLTDRLPLCVVLAGRVDPASPGWPLITHIATTYHHRLARVELAPLSDEDAGMLMDAISSTGALERSARAEVVARAEGNPLFIVELTSSLQETGGLARTQGWTLSLTTVGALMPARLEDVLSMRIQGLDADARHLAQAAAVLGGETPVGAAAAVGEVDDPDAAATALIRARVMREAGRAPDLILRFQHAMLKDAVIATLTPDRARAMYGRAADLIEPGDDHLERRALSLYRAGRWAEAVETLTALAERAERAAPAQAVELWTMTARAAGHLGDEKVAGAATERADALRTPWYPGQNWRPDPLPKG